MAAMEQKVLDPDNVILTAEDVAKHATKTDFWTILKGRVYDVTEYAHIHPGANFIYEGLGRDVTELFNQHHPFVNHNALIGKYQMGVIEEYRNQKLQMDDEDARITAAM